MNKIKILITVAVTALAVSCSADFDGNEPQQGYLKLSAVSVDVETTSIPESRATVDAGDFIVEISRDGETVASYDKASDLPDVIELDLGDYTVSARNTTLTEAAFEAPYYFASEDFEIKNNVITEVGPLECKLSNIKVTIEFSEALESILGSSTYVSAGYENGTKLYYNLTSIASGQAGYFEERQDDGRFEVIFNGEVDGEKTVYTSYCEDVKAGQHRIITYNLKDADGEESTSLSRGVSAGRRSLIVTQTVE